MQTLEPRATWNHRYRLDRLVVAQNGVTVWEVTDVRDGRRAELAIFDHGSTVLDHGVNDGGTFVVLEAKPRPCLELVEISDEDAFFEEAPRDELFEDMPPPSRRRGRIWAAGVVTCIAVAVAGLYFGAPRASATSETTITAARIDPPQPAIAEPPPPVAPAVSSVSPEPPPRPVVHAVAPPPAPKPHRVPMRAPRRHAPPPRPAPPPPPPATMQSDPVTL